MIIRWSPVQYNGHAAYVSAAFVRTWVPSGAALTIVGGGTSNYLLLLGVGS